MSAEANEGESRISLWKLYDYAVQINEAFNGQHTRPALSKLALKDIAELFLYVEKLIRESTDEVLRSKFSVDGRQNEMIDRVRNVQMSVLNRVPSNTNGSIIVSDVLLSDLRGVAEHVEEKGTQNIGAVDRRQVITSTENLIEEVKEWEIDEYSKTALLLKLNAVQRVVQIADIFTETEIRLRVKEVVADFAAEFGVKDKKYQSKMEKIKTWAMEILKPAGTFLGLTSNAATIAGYITGPSE